MNLISSNHFFKNTITPFIRRTYKNSYISNNEDYSINDTKLSRNEKNKTFFFQKKNLLYKRARLFSTRNPQIISKLNKNIKSATIKSPGLKENIFYPIKLKQDKMSNTGISFYRNNIKKLKRNYSAYYIKSDLPLGQNYISDFLVKSKELKIKSCNISEIEQKIRKLGKTLNLFIFKKQNLSELNRTFSGFPYKRFINQQIKQIKYNNNSTHDDEGKKNKNETIKLPDFLKNEFNIKGTKILSPFCLKARDNFILKKFTQYFDDKNNLKSDTKYINNKLNIIYAEDEDAYNMKLALLNKKLNMQGKIDKYQIGFSPSEKLLRDMEKKVTFMKNIVEYAYPNTALMRMRIPESKKYFMKYKYKYDFKNKDVNNEKLNEVQRKIYKLPNKASKNNFRRNKKHSILYK